MSQPTVLLFDIDGTLISAAGAGRRSLERAFDAYCQRPDACDAISFAGMTDPLIVRTALEGLNLVYSEDAQKTLFELYLGFLAEEVPRSSGYRVMPGVHALLNALLDRKGIAMGLGTGNIEAGARTKLKRAQLNAYFTFGGFGSDHLERTELIRTGALRGAQKLGCTLFEARVVVIGDTPRDVSAALGIGAECLAVTTGSYNAEALTGAHRIVDDLANTEDMVRWLTGS